MDSIINPRAVAGHNEPPLAERLAADHADLLKRVAEALDTVPEKLRAIANDEEAQGYTDAAAALKAIEKEAGEAFKPEKKPWLEGGNTVDTFFAFRKKLQEAAKRAVTALNAWQTAQLAAKRKAEAEAAALAAKEAALFDEPVPVAAPVIVKEAVRVVSAASGAKASGSIKWVGDVENADLVPREYLMVNQAKIDAAVAGGTRTIPGVKIHETVNTSIRR